MCHVKVDVNSINHLNYLLHELYLQFIAYQFCITSSASDIIDIDISLEFMLS